MVAQPTRLLSNYEVYAVFVDLVDDVGADSCVGDDKVDVIDIADFCESSFAKLGGVGKHDHLLSRPHHLLVELRLTHIGSSESKVEVYSVNP